MFKLYKRLRPIDWVLLLVLVGLTVVQVYCTMTLVDQIQNIIRSITYVNYHNHPELLDETGTLAGMVTMLGGWENVTVQSLEQVFLAQIMQGADMSGLINTLVDIANASTGDIWKYGGLMLAVAAGSAGAQALVGLIASYVASQLSKRLRTEIYTKVDGLSKQERDKFSTPSLITRTTNDVQQVQIANILMLRMAFAAPITAVWAICKIQAASGELTIATAVAIVLLVLFLALLMVFALPKFKITQKLIDRINGVSRENLTGIRVVRAYNAEKYQEAKFAKANDDITRVQLFTSRAMSLMSPVMMIIMNGISLAIYWLGASLINRGITDYPTVTAFMSLASQIIMAFMMLMMMFVLMPRAIVSAKRINEVLDTKPSIHDPETETEPTEVGTVEFDNVSFAYADSDLPVIKNISFKANRGETVAFIGSTGSGKSTLINLVPRFYDATEGTVKVDGVDVRELKQSTLRSKIGYVPQKGVLFTGTVKENIAFGKPDATDDEIVAAAKVAEADEFIRGMELEYD